MLKTLPESSRVPYPQVYTIFIKKLTGLGIFSSFQNSSEILLFESVNYCIWMLCVDNFCMIIMSRVSFNTCDISFLSDGNERKETKVLYVNVTKAGHLFFWSARVLIFLQINHIQRPFRNRNKSFSLYLFFMSQS